MAYFSLPAPSRRDMQMNDRPTFPEPWTAPTALLHETKPCACCSAEIPCGEFGDDRDGFDALILHDEGVLCCHACVPSWLEDAAESALTDRERPYAGGLAVWG